MVLTIYLLIKILNASYIQINIAQRIICYLDNFSYRKKYQVICVSSIMGKILLSATIFMLSIIIVDSNLILFGDFQNIACGPVCNDTWFASNGNIQLTYDYPYIYTINADLQNYGRYQLCQNISSMQIGKTYIFTFDILCNKHFYQNCSIWVLINNEVVNGSNYTNYDYFPHTVVGYLNSTLTNNKICFQSSEAPNLPGYGSRIDNITLQIFNGNVACNVPGCELCVLNFPNSCNLCQAGYVKQANQACTNCVAIIYNCARCQRITNYYACQQCAPQFSLNTQRNLCYHNSEIFFTSEVSETASISNSFIIKTNLSTALLIQAGFTIQNLPSVMIQINGDKQQNITTTLKEGGFLEVKVNLAHQYQSFNIKFEVEQGFIKINNTYYSIRTAVNKKPSVFLSETQIAIFQKYDELAKPIIQNLDATFVIIKNSGLGFFIASIFNYLNLMTFYSYLNMQQPKTFRLFIESLSSQLNSYSLYKLINLQTQIYEIAQYQVTEKIKVSRQECLGPLQAGFSTNFYKNNLQPLTIIAIFGVRLALCWILHKIFKASFLQSSSSQRFVSISSQFQTIIPIVVLPSFNLTIRSIYSRNYVESINTILHIIVLFICLLIPVVQLLIQLRQIELKNSKKRKKLQIQIKNSKKTRKNNKLQCQIESAEVTSLQGQKGFEQRRNELNQQEKNGLIQVKFKLVSRLKLLSIPIFVVFQQVLPFLVINLCLLLICFMLSLKLKNYFSIYQFILNTIISLAWLLLHCCFCVFFIIQKWLLDQGSTSTVLQVAKYVSYSSIIIILFGAIVQIIDCLVGVADALRQIVIYVYQKYKKSIKIVPQSKKKQKNQSQKVYRNQIRNKKLFKIKLKSKNIKQSKVQVKSKTTGKKFQTQKANNKQNYCDLVVNRQLFQFYQPQNYKKNTGISMFNGKNLKRQKVNNEKNSGKPVMNPQLFYFFQPQTQKKNTNISKLNNQNKISRKVKKVKEQVEIHQLGVRFRNQN